MSASEQDVPSDLLEGVSAKLTKMSEDIQSGNASNDILVTLVVVLLLVIVGVMAYRFHMGIDKYDATMEFVNSTMDTMNMSMVTEDKENPPSS